MAVRINTMPQYDSPGTITRFTTSKPPPPAANAAHVTPTANGRTEYISGQRNPQLGRYIRSLPKWIDDITHDFGRDMYERMLNDPQVFSCVEILKLSIMSKKWQVHPAIKNKKSKYYSVAKKIANFCEYNLLNLPIPFEQFIYEMLDAVAYGNMLAEKIYKFDMRGRIILANLKVKMRDTFAFVVDPFLNIVGILGIIPGVAYTLYEGSTIFDPWSTPNLLPREKFVILTHNQKAGDPRGRSCLRPVYDPWWQKVQLKGEYLKNMSQFGSPSLWGTTPPNATAMPPTDYLGNATGASTVTPEAALLAALQSIQNGSCGAFAAETNINLIPPQAGPFLEAIEFHDRQITKGILGQTLATEEGEHQARAASDNHKDILDMVMAAPRRNAEAMVRRDIFFDLVRYNFGEKAAQLLCPTITLGESDVQDWHADVSSVVSMATSGFLAPSQFLWADEKLGLPARTDKSKLENEIDGSDGAVDGQTVPKDGEPAPAAKPTPVEPAPVAGGKSATNPPSPKEGDPREGRTPPDISKILANFSLTAPEEKEASVNRVKSYIKARKPRRRLVTA